MESWETLCLMEGRKKRSNQDSFVLYIFGAFPFRILLWLLFYLCIMYVCMCVCILYLCIYHLSIYLFIIYLSSTYHLSFYLSSIYRLSFFYLFCLSVCLSICLCIIPCQSLLKWSCFASKNSQAVSAIAHSLDFKFWVSPGRFLQKALFLSLPQT